MAQIIPRNPLAFPGGNPGFNPGHPAARGIRLSLVAAVGGVPRIITAPGVTGKFTVHGTITSSSWATGPAITATSAGANYLSIPALNETPTAVTFGMIVSPAGSLANGVVLSVNGATSSFYFSIHSLSPQLFLAGAGIFTTTALTIGRSYFVAGSYSGAGCSLVVVDLFGGKLFSSLATAATAFPAPTNSQYNLVALGSGLFPCNAYVSAFSYSINTCLSRSQLLQWAQAPWDFWYPPTLGNMLVTGVRTGSGVAPASQARAMVMA